MPSGSPGPRRSARAERRVRGVGSPLRRPPPRGGPSATSGDGASLPRGSRWCRATRTEPRLRSGALEPQPRDPHASSTFTGEVRTRAPTADSSRLVCSSNRFVISPRSVAAARHGFDTLSPSLTGRVRFWMTCGGQRARPETTRGSASPQRARASAAAHPHHRFGSDGRAFAEQNSRSAAVRPNQRRIMRSVPSNVSSSANPARSETMSRQIFT